MQNNATEKQFNYAKDISELLGVPMPNDFTVESYSGFISRYVNEYKREKQKFSFDDLGEEDEW